MLLLELELVGFLRFSTPIFYADPLRLENKLAMDYTSRR